MDGATKIQAMARSDSPFDALRDRRRRRLRSAIDR